MRVRDIAAAIESFAPLTLQESYDNSGLIVGRMDDEVSKALLAVDVTEEVIEEALAEGCAPRGGFRLSADEKRKKLF